MKVKVWKWHGRSVDDLTEAECRQALRECISHICRQRRTLEVEHHMAEIDRDVDATFRSVDHLFASISRHVTGLFR